MDGSGWCGIIIIIPEVTPGGYRENLKPAV